MKKIRFLEKLLGKSQDSDEDDLSKLDKKLDSVGRNMVRGIMELPDTSVREIMVPRTDVLFLSLDTPMDEMLTVISECNHSRLPVYEGTIDNVVGILYLKDLLKLIIKHDLHIELKDIHINEIIRKPYFVPESKKLDSLLKEFKRRKVHIAIVVDEYGGTSGIVCMEDIIEEIVGEIQDEFDNETEDIIKISDNVYLCDARANLEDLNKQLGLDLPVEDIDTLGGFVFDLLGKIPVKYEKVAFNHIDFIVQEINGHKIESVKIILNQESSQTGS